MDRYWLLLLIALFVVETSFAHKFPFKNIGAFCKDDTPQGDPNMLPIESGPPRLIRTVENGSLYQVGVGEDQSWLVHVWGMTGYDYGFAYGSLLSQQINEFAPAVYVYLEQQVLHSIEDIKLPQWFKEFIVDNGLGVALDLQNTLVHSYMDEEIYNELRGIADSAKVDYKLLVRLHMFGELTRGNISVNKKLYTCFIYLYLGHCSYYGIWGKAALGGKTLQMRAFDWDMDANLQEYPVITVYHPRSSKLGHTFTNVAWAGNISLHHSKISLYHFFRLYWYFYWYVFNIIRYDINRY
jgi:hypothetical protein